MFFLLVPMWMVGWATCMGLGYKVRVTTPQLMCVVLCSQPHTNNTSTTTRKNHTGGRIYYSVHDNNYALILTTFCL